MIINLLDENIKKVGLTHVELYHQSADKKFPRFSEPMDTIVINSVAQYFPSVHYFLNVIDRCVAELKDGGSIFLGDLRSLPLLTLQSTSIELFQMKEDDSLSALKEKVRRRVSAEEELLFHPAIFAQIKERHPSITSIELASKRSQFRNEMAAFRFDVVMHISGKSRRTLNLQSNTCIDASQALLDHDALATILKSGTGPIFVKNIRNARFADDANVAERLTTSSESERYSLKADLTAQRLPNDSYIFEQ